MTPEPIPFEPNRSRKKSAKSQPSPAPKSSRKSSDSSKSSKGTSASESRAIAKRSPQQRTDGKPDGETTVGEKKSAGKSERMAIPEMVSQRMLRRMVLFSGLPSSMGILSIIASYFIVSRHWLELPNTAVLLVSLGCFGLGVIGLSYGVLSSSWDEDRVGTRLGWGEFVTNWKRMTEAWRESRVKKKS